MGKKIGRNEPCPCGSGKKYKKCCIDKPDNLVADFAEYLNNFMSYEEVNKLSTQDIIDKLENIGILFDRDAFLKDICKHHTAEDISEQWFKSFHVIAEGRDEDFPFFAAWILWERLAPPHILSKEQIDDLLTEGYEYRNINDSKAACDSLLKVWEALKFRFKPEHKNMDYLDAQYGSCFYIKEFCEDLLDELLVAGMIDESYIEKRLTFCNEFISNFPEEGEEIIFQIRCGSAESHYFKGNPAKADAEFESIVQDFPDNLWGYIRWGDLYAENQVDDMTKARVLYEKAFEMARNEEEIESIKERMS